MTVAGWIFPGQGAQSARMGAKFIGRTSFEAMIDRIEDMSAQPVRDFITSLAEPELRRTDRAQLAIFAMSLSIAACLREEGLRPALVAGHSLGHFSAMVVAGALCLEDAIFLVVQRGRLMRSAGEGEPGGMAVVQGLDAGTVARILAKAQLRVWPANLNLPEQIVVSGAVRDLGAARKDIVAAGGKWASLNVSGAFHSPLLAREAEAFARQIGKIRFHDPVCPILSNRNGAALNRACDIQSELAGHMTSQVHWTAVMQEIVDRSPDVLIEVGPGKILTGLMLQFKPALKPGRTGNPLLMDRVIAAQKHAIREWRHDSSFCQA